MRQEFAFKEMKNGKYKILSMYAKFARGLMARWVIQNRVEKPEELKNQGGWLRLQ